MLIRRERYNIMAEMIDIIILSYIKRFNSFDPLYISEFINEPIPFIVDSYYDLLDRKFLKEEEGKIIISEGSKGNPLIDWNLWNDGNNILEDGFSLHKEFDGEYDSYGIPIFKTQEEVLNFLELENVSFDRYSSFFLEKNGKTREITAPNRKLKKRQRWILENILNKVNVSECVHGFVPGRSIVTNAKVHVNKNTIMCFDISNFFPSISADNVFSIFCQLGYNDKVAALFTNICTYVNALPQGAPTSPMIANIMFRKTDDKLIEFAEAHGLCYTRYADDMTFSGDYGIEKYEKDICQIVENEGWRINGEKTHIMTVPKRQMVTGLVVSDTVKVPKKFKRLFRQEIYYCRKYGVTSHLLARNRTSAVNYESYMYGKAYFVNMVEREEGQKMLKELDDIFSGNVESVEMQEDLQDSM